MQLVGRSALPPSKILQVQVRLAGHRGPGGADASHSSSSRASRSVRCAGGKERVNSSKADG
jgi:hypothetical protein